METPEDFAARTGAFYASLPDRLDGIKGTINRAQAFRRALYDEGLAGAAYPMEMGGLGLTPEHVAAANAASLKLLPPETSAFGIGVGMCLPTIRDLGSEVLQQRFIRPGLRGDEIWCQLYSEPGAGSDLAGLTCRAIRDGDEWIVKGQKVWTSGAQHSHLAILIARTDPELPKHRGITMFVIDMKQPGVTVRPLVQMTGQAEFNEVFLDEARIPIDWVVGEVNGGWALAKALLAHERSSLGRGVKTDNTSRSVTGPRAPLPFVGLRERAVEHGLHTDPEMRQKLAQAWIGEKLIPWNARRGLHPSIGKLWRSIQGRHAAQVAHEIGGALSTAWEPEDADAHYWSHHMLNCRGMSLGGGTDEVQKNTLGERVLGLPREPGPPRDTPFRELLSNERSSP